MADVWAWWFCSQKFSFVSFYSVLTPRAAMRSSRPSFLRLFFIDDQ